MGASLTYELRREVTKIINSINEDNPLNGVLSDQITLQPEKFFLIEEDKSEGILEPATTTIVVSFIAASTAPVVATILIDLWKLYVLDELEKRHGVGVLKDK